MSPQTIVVTAKYRVIEQEHTVSKVAAGIAEAAKLQGDSHVPPGAYEVTLMIRPIPWAMP